MKLRVLKKRGKTRRDRVEALSAEVKELEAQQRSTKVRRFLFDGGAGRLLSYTECESNNKNRTTRKSPDARIRSVLALFEVFSFMFPYPLAAVTARVRSQYH